MVKLKWLLGCVSVFTTKAVGWYDVVSLLFECFRVAVFVDYCTVPS